MSKRDYNDVDLSVISLVSGAELQSICRKGHPGVGPDDISATGISDITFFTEYDQYRNGVSPFFGVLILGIVPISGKEKLAKKNGVKLREYLKDIFGLDVRIAESDDPKDVFKELVKFRMDNAKRFNIKIDAEKSKAFERIPDAGLDTVFSTKKLELPKDVLIACRNETPLGLLRFTNGKIHYEKFDEDEKFPFARLFPVAGALDDHEFLLAWLKSLMPGKKLLTVMDDVLQNPAAYWWGKSDASIFENGILTEEGIFRILERYGSSLGNSVSFILPRAYDLPPLDNFLTFSAMNYPQKYQGEYTPVISPFFPGQNNGFVIDTTGGLWDSGDGNGGQYFIPLEAYGKDRMAKRLLSLCFARTIGMDTVDAKVVRLPYEGKELLGVAFSRFDIRGGKMVYRIPYSRLADLANLSSSDSFDRLCKMLPNTTNRDLACQCVLSLIIFGESSEPTLIEVLPDAYHADEFNVKLDKDVDNGNLRCAPFTGIVGDYGGIEIQEAENVFENFSCSKEEGREFYKRCMNPNAWETAKKFAILTFPEIFNGTGV